MAMINLTFIDMFLLWEFYKFKREFKPDISQNKTNKKILLNIIVLQDFIYYFGTLSKTIRFLDI